MPQPTSRGRRAQHSSARSASKIRPGTIADRLAALLAESPGEYSIAELADLLDADKRDVSRALAKLRAADLLVEHYQWIGPCQVATHRAIKGAPAGAVNVHITRREMVP